MKKLLVLALVVAGCSNEKGTVKVKDVNGQDIGWRLEEYRIGGHQYIGHLMLRDSKANLLCHKADCDNPIHERNTNDE
jgi:hypothetical protein